MRGKVHSLETLGALDGPGLRCVAFLQGCPLRCQYCHNPDAWSFKGGMGQTAEAVVTQVARLRPYFGKRGGITLSGGEPLAQPEFATEILRQCRALNIHTALDTSGAYGGERALEVLRYTDLVILDVKHTDPKRYRALTGGQLERTWEFLQYVAGEGIALWVRQVIVPGWNDTEANVLKLAEKLCGLPTLQRVELLPYHRLGMAKWEKLGLQSPLADVPAADAKHVTWLEQCLRTALGFTLRNFARNELSPPRSGRRVRFVEAAEHPI